MHRYVVSDLHGMKPLFDQIVNFIQPDDIIYCLGDNADRGPNGWAIIKAMLTDKRFVYLKGNHEDLLYRAMLEVDEPHSRTLDILIYNGGWQTYCDWLSEERPELWMPEIHKLPTYCKVETESGDIFHLSHAGFTPGDMTNLLWNRDHIYDKWPDGHDNEFIIHGHTPAQLIVKDFNDLRRIRGIPEEVQWEPGATYYSRGHKICIDNGSPTTGIACLFDIDTFDEHIFQCEVNYND